MLLTRRRRVAFAALLVAAPAAALLAPLVAMAQGQDEIVEVDLDDAGCFGHHAAETPPFRTTVIIAPAPLAEVPQGEAFDLPVQVQVAWKQEMLNLKVSLNLSQAPGLQFVVEGEHPPLEETTPGTASLNQAVEVPFAVDPNATELAVVLDGDAGPLGADDLDLYLQAPSGRIFNRTLPDSSLENLRRTQKEPISDEAFRLSQDQILDGGIGPWVALVVYEDGVSPQTAFNVHVGVWYNTSTSAELFLPVEQPNLPAGGISNVTFRLRAVAQGDQVVGVRSLGQAHYVHTDAQATDDGNFSKVQPMRFAVGSTFRVEASTAGLVDVGFDPATKLMRQWGFLLGWLGFFLVPPSLVLGGTFGGRTVRALNRAVGSARQRVLWHNALSYVLLGIGLVHMVLFLVETTYHWTVGIVWGSLTLAAMIGLGVTGALQTRIAKSYGYATWRFTHFLLGMLVVAFVTLHAVVDGVDFQFLRDYFL